MLALKASLPKDESSETLRPTIARAKETIDKARKLISANLKSLLALENRAAGVQATADSLVAEIDSLLQALRGDLFQKSAPSMFSPEYFGQFNTAIRDDLRKGFEFVSESQWEVLQRNALFIVLQVALWLISALVIIRNRAALAAEPRLLFLPSDPLPLACSLALWYSSPFMKRASASGGWSILPVVFPLHRPALWLLIAGAWRRRAVYVLVIVLVINEFLQLSDFPRPLFRLFVLFVSLMGLFLCVWRVLNRARRGETRRYRWVLWGGIIVSGMMLVANVSGYSALAAHLLEASLRTVLLFILGWILMASGRGGLERIFKSATVTRIPLLQKNAAAIVHVSSRLLDLL